MAAAFHRLTERRYGKGPAQYDATLNRISLMTSPVASPRRFAEHYYRGTGGVGSSARSSTMAPHPNLGVALAAKAPLAIVRNGPLAESRIGTNSSFSLHRGHGHFPLWNGAGLFEFIILPVFRLRPSARSRVSPTGLHLRRRLTGVAPVRPP